MKYCPIKCACLNNGSLPVRGAWIEIIKAARERKQDPRRSPYGERGLKYLNFFVNRAKERRSPYGERGLKCPRRRLPAAGRSRSPYGERGLK